MDLTPRQQRFVDAYLGDADGNATRAAEAAGYAWPDKQGSQLLGKTRIKNAISVRLTASSLSRDQILAWLYEIASGGMSEVVKLDGDGWRPDLKTAKRKGRFGLIKKLKATEFGTEIEVYSRLDAIDRLARYHGLYDAKLTETIKEVDDIKRRLAEKKAKP